MALQDLPSVDRLLHTTTAAEMIAEYGRPLTLEGLRKSLSVFRAAHMQDGAAIPNIQDVLSETQKRLVEWSTPTLSPVINATGVILHTNLGRAPLSQASINAMNGVASGYSNLEYDLDKGARGSRLYHAAALLTRLTGAEDAMVVNNNASALMLILAALAKRRRVVISRTQLIEIGGGFRIPDVMKQSGAILEEIGATNKVNLNDYEAVFEEKSVALILQAHRSNFRLVGFTEEPSAEELAHLAHSYGVPYVNDLGSGTLLDTEKYGLDHEPTIQEMLALRADLVCFSGDKLLGGPQAGIIVGKEELIKRLRKHPLARALRADKLCLAALTATLTHYLKDEAEREIPVWQMISMVPKLLQMRAQKWAQRLEAGSVIEGISAVGGGSLPGETLPTSLLALEVKSPDRFLKKLREQNPAIVARTENDRVVFDPRSVLPVQDSALLTGIQQALKEESIQ